jgi:hypothetical protein
MNYKGYEIKAEEVVPGFLNVVIWKAVVTLDGKEFEKLFGCGENEEAAIECSKFFIDCQE